MYYSNSDYYVSNVVNSINPRQHYTINNLKQAEQALKDSLTDIYAVQYIKDYVNSHLG